MAEENPLMALYNDLLTRNDDPETQDPSTNLSDADIEAALERDNGS